MIALDCKYYSRVNWAFFDILNTALSYILLSREAVYPKILHAVKIRTSANYCLARKSSSSRGPNAAFARVTEIRKNFYTL